MFRRLLPIVLLCTGLFVAWEMGYSPERHRNTEVGISAAHQRETGERKESERGKGQGTTETSAQKNLAGGKEESQEASLFDDSISLEEFSKGAGRKKSFGRFTDQHGIEREYVKGMVLVKFREVEGVRALKAEEGKEPEFAKEIAGKPEVEFAELNVKLERQFTPNDSLLGSQWHHDLIGSAQAWEVGLATHHVKVAVVDWPFQMNHPDLAANVVPGWDLVRGTVISENPQGDFHSTHGAGLIAGVINNGAGVAGTVNAQVLPIDIEGELLEMYHAILWCSTNGVRVVNLSWDGCYSSTLNSAAEILKERNNGMVIMAGVNKVERLPYVNQPLIYAISATDRNDVQRTSWGAHIDFAAPGWLIYSTTSGSSYKSDSGTSYSAPLFAGIVAMIMTLNPDLGPAQIAEIMQKTAVDRGAVGRDDFFGFGRIHFGRAVIETMRTSPYFQMRAAKAEAQARLWMPQLPGAIYTLEQAGLLPGGLWRQASVMATTNGGKIEFLAPLERGEEFFQARVRVP